MDPVVTLPYSEGVVADRLSKLLPSREGYSICAPLSRQGKRFDLVVAKRQITQTTAVTVQVKFSRVYPQPESRGCKFATWFNTFEPAPQADLLAIASLYPANEKRQRGLEAWWQPLVLLFTDVILHHERENAHREAGQNVRLWIQFTGAGVPAPRRPRAPAARFRAPCS